MRIEVKIHPYLRQCVSAPEKLLQGETWDVPEGTSAAQIVALLNIPEGFPVVVMINDSCCSDLPHNILSQKDIVFVSPVMAGG